jgi:hypothetical protein
VIIEEALAGKSATIRPQLDERQWRMFLAVEADAIGWGGIGLVARPSVASRTPEYYLRDFVLGLLDWAGSSIAPLWSV